MKKAVVAKIALLDDQIVRQLLASEDDPYVLIVALEFGRQGSLDLLHCP